MTTPKRADFRPERDGSGALTWILIALVVVAVLGAKYYGVLPGKKTPDTPQSSVGDTPSVVLYAAHPSENYMPQAAHAQGAGDVTTLLAELRNALRGHNVNAIVAEPVINAPWDIAFSAAREKVQPYLVDEDAVAAVLDVHRDALEGRADGYTTLMIGSTPVARILLVVGDVDNPYVEQNLSFAEALRSELEAVAPGICRGVKVLPDRINGDLHPRSVQVFIGDYNDNTMAEAQAAVGYLAQALVRVLQR